MNTNETLRKLDQFCTVLAGLTWQQPQMALDDISMTSAWHQHDISRQILSTTSVKPKPECTIRVGWSKTDNQINYWAVQCLERLFRQNGHSSSGMTLNAPKCASFRKIQQDCVEWQRLEQNGSKIWFSNCAMTRKPFQTKRSQQQWHNT